ncbi:maleylpyruvate isomerase family mycothiol-dependent enzyme [Williamsia sp. D3]|uniref:maleylpyruvate isomerase family mycothiol-dependent enzyme n=1 Tax=Williamsia sp. D3 TaxID=1313067 RepID=UPI0004CF852D|nr:maleylpyruvate isomerase family mycothiol-dependent enzyme [Williamsia sp. D3]
MNFSDALLEQNRLLGEAIRHADFALPVPTCPEWNIQQLFRHVGRGDRWAAQIVGEQRDSPADPRQVPNGKPPEDIDGAIEWFNDGVQKLLAAVAETGADTPVWTFTGPQPAAWWIRRRLHETTVHRADAQLALDVPFDLVADLAADGISEWLGLMSARPAGATAPLDNGATLHLHASETDLGPDGEWFIRGEEGTVAWDHSHAKADAAVRGPASGLLLAISRRKSAEEAGLEILGDRQVWDTWLERTQF